MSYNSDSTSIFRFLFYTFCRGNQGFEKYSLILPKNKGNLLNTVKIRKQKNLSWMGLEPMHCFFGTRHPNYRAKKHVVSSNSKFQAEKSFKIIVSFLVVAFHKKMFPTITVTSFQVFLVRPQNVCEWPSFQVFVHAKLFT